MLEFSHFIMNQLYFCLWSWYHSHKLQFLFKLYDSESCSFHWILIAAAALTGWAWLFCHFANWLSFCSQWCFEFWLRSWCSDKLTDCEISLLEWHIKSLRLNFNRIWWILHVKREVFNIQSDLKDFTIKWALKSMFWWKHWEL